MAFGIKRNELRLWKENVASGKIAFLTHYWMDKRFPDCFTVTKVGCSDIAKLAKWGEKYGLKVDWIHMDEEYPHFDLFGKRQKHILINERVWDQINRFKL